LPDFDHDCDEDKGVITPVHSDKSESSSVSETYKRFLEEKNQVSSDSDCSYSSDDSHSKSYSEQKYIPAFVEAQQAQQAQPKFEAFETFELFKKSNEN